MTIECMPLITRKLLFFGKEETLYEVKNIMVCHRQEIKIAVHIVVCNIHSIMLSNVKLRNYETVTIVKITSLIFKYCKDMCLSTI